MHCAKVIQIGNTCLHPTSNNLLRTEPYLFHIMFLASMLPQNCCSNGSVYIETISE